MMRKDGPRDIPGYSTLNHFPPLATHPKPPWTALSDLRNWNGVFPRYQPHMHSLRISVRLGLQRSERRTLRPPLRGPLHPLSPTRALPRSSRPPTFSPPRSPPGRERITQGP